MKSCKYHIGFFNCLLVDCDGRSGGVALLWKKDINLSVISFSKFHIDALIQDDADNSKDWYLKGVYGHPNIGCPDWDFSKPQSLS